MFIVFGVFIGIIGGIPDKRIPEGRRVKTTYKKSKIIYDWLLYWPSNLVGEKNAKEGGGVLIIKDLTTEII